MSHNLSELAGVIANLPLFSQRLREEVDTLKHLSDVARTSGLGNHHPNVMGYLDSWEEDETLYISTELCELGNFSHFLWQYGRAFPRLDEARVWKIFAELSSVRDAGCFQLSNILTSGCRAYSSFTAQGSSTSTSSLPTSSLRVTADSR